MLKNQNVSKFRDFKKILPKNAFAVFQKYATQKDDREPTFS